MSMIRPVHGPSRSAFVIWASTQNADLMMWTVAVLRRPTSTSIRRDTLQMLVIALVHSRLDYGNSVLTGIPAYLTRRLLNAAARLLYAAEVF